MERSRGRKRCLLVPNDSREVCINKEDATNKIGGEDAYEQASCFILTLIFAVIVGGCSKNEAPATPPKPGAITGTVRSGGSHTLIQGAVVTTLPTTTTDTTDAGGLYLLQNVHSGNYLLIARATDFAVDPSNVTVSAGSTITHHISLVATTGAITGAVTCRGPGIPITGAVIRTIPPTSADTADINGEYTLLGIPIGPYTVFADAEGFVADSIQALTQTEILGLYNSGQ